jgi:hypothetical protein
MNIQIGDMLKFNDKFTGKGICLVTDIQESPELIKFSIIWLKSVGFESEYDTVPFLKTDFGTTFHKYWNKIS